MTTITLRGMTWDHPRGYDPLALGVPLFQAANPDINIVWEKRSLRQFGEAPLDQYAEQYDLIIIDHPFAGFAARHPYLIDWSEHLSAEEQDVFAKDSVGRTWDSYRYRDRICALPIDAATQVSSYRPDLMARLNAAPPKTFEDVLRLAEKARASGLSITTTACPTDAVSTLISIAANLGHGIVDETSPFLPSAIGREVLSHFHAIVDVSHPSACSSNPIQAYDRMIGGNEIAYCVYGYGYTNYSRPVSGSRLKFTNVPAHGSLGCAGTQLGGTGVAVSALSSHREAAVRYGKWLCSKGHQASDYFALGGQPASLAAWKDPALNGACDDFFLGTLATLESAHVRPRFDGWVPLFEELGERTSACMKRELDDDKLIAWINSEFAHVQARAGLQIT